MGRSEFSIPEQLARTAIELEGPAGRDWLDRLPAIVAGCARRWSLAVAPPFPNLSYNYVAPATRADGAAAVLKVCLPNSEYRTEAAALRLFDGRGAARLLEADLEQAALLLERLEPGTPLTAVPDDERATIIAAGVMRRLWRPAPADAPFPSVGDWVRGMARRAPGVLGRDAAFPTGWLDRALALFAELDASAPEPALLHGDLHHGNILAARREPWLAIDPKGVTGEPAAELGALLLNPIPQLLERPQPGRLLARRVALLAGALDLDPARVRDWGVVRAVLSAFWSLEDHGYGWEYGIAVAELLAA
jgi:streptomycin 6-kinase